jgi:hypothetical protein
MRKIKDPAKEISVNDFFKYCADMQDKIRQFGIDRCMINSRMRAKGPMHYLIALSE